MNDLLHMEIKDIFHKFYLTRENCEVVLRLKESYIPAPVTDVPQAKVNVVDEDRAEIVQALPDVTRTTFVKYANNDSSETRIATCG